MAKQTLNTGAVPSDGTGDTTRVAWTKVNENFTEVYEAIDGVPTLPLAIGDTTGLQTALDAKAAQSDVTGLTAALAGKAATSHAHAIADTTGLQAALDDKAATSHAHAIADTTGLQAALDAKAATTLAPVALTYGATLAPNCNDGLYRKVTLTGNATLNAPTNGTEGMKWKAKFLASGANRTLTFQAAIKIPSASTFTGAQIIVSGETYMAQLEYSGAAWWLQTLIGGWA